MLLFSSLYEYHIIIIVIVMAGLTFCFEIRSANYKSQSVLNSVWCMDVYFKLLINSNYYLYSVNIELLIFAD